MNSRWRSPASRRGHPRPSSADNNYEKLAFFDPMTIELDKTNAIDISVNFVIGPAVHFWTNVGEDQDRHSQGGPC